MKPAEVTTESSTLEEGKRLGGFHWKGEVSEDGVSQLVSCKLHTLIRYKTANDETKQTPEVTQNANNCHSHSSKDCVSVSNKN